MSHSDERPYLEIREEIVTHHYNPKFGNDELCSCGHPYYRHFDTYNAMEPIGCKYCECWVFSNITIEKSDITMANFDELNDTFEQINNNKAFVLEYARSVCKNLGHSQTEQRVVAAKAMVTLLRSAGDQLAKIIENSQ